VPATSEKLNHGKRGTWLPVTGEALLNEARHNADFVVLKRREREDAGRSTGKIMSACFDVPGIAAQIARMAIS
jgi:hypothetical protein